MNLTTLFLSLFSVSNIIFPNISISGVNIGQKKLEDATLILSQNFSKPKNIKLYYNGQEFVITPEDIDFTYNYLESAQRAYSLVKTGNPFEDITIKIDTLVKPKNLGLIANYNQEKLNSIISIIYEKISTEPYYPEISLVKDNIEFKNGTAGTIVDKNELSKKIANQISFYKDEAIGIPTKIVDPKLNDQEVDDLYNRAGKLINKKLEIKFEYQPGQIDTYTKNDSDLIKYLNPTGGYNEKEINKFIDDLSLKINRDPQDSKFKFENGKVTEFQPSLEGVKIDKTKLLSDIQNALKNNQSIIYVPATKTPPKLSTDKVNNLGIRELIGRGTSTYFHSIPGRVHNVTLAASRINGTLVAPNETFSFNKTLGDVSKFTGYQSAYVILSGKTVLGDGGGVCQVSSTLFRAVLNTGLPVDQRTAHAYRVGYYEQGSSPGFDATVYSPFPDFKFTNNTGNYILISAVADPKNYSLVFEIYGTNDGRISTVSKPVIANQTAPGPDVYQDDPSLPAGTIKQVEYRAYGAKVSFDYLVTKGGEEIYKKTFVSNYKPWEAVYLKGTKI